MKKNNENVSAKKIEWGKIGEYLTTDLLNLTNISSFLSQEMVDEINSKLSVESNGFSSEIVDKDGNPVDSSFYKYTIPGDSKYSYYTKTMKDGKTQSITTDSLMSGEHTEGRVDGGLHNPGIECETVNNNYGTWRYCKIRIFPLMYDKDAIKKVSDAVGWSSKSKAKRNRLDPCSFCHVDIALIIEQDYDGSIKFFKGKYCPVKITEKRYNLAEIKEETKPNDFGMRPME